MKAWQILIGAVLGGAVLVPPLAAQASQSSPFRPYLFVILAFAAAWLMVAAWAFLMGRRLLRLARRIEEESGGVE